MVLQIFRNFQIGQYLAESDKNLVAHFFMVCGITISESVIQHNDESVIAR